MTQIDGIRQHPPGGPAGLVFEQLEQLQPEAGRRSCASMPRRSPATSSTGPPTAFPLVDARRAFERLESDRSPGKIVLRVAGE